MIALLISAGIPFLVIYILVRNYLRLRHIPGPLAAKFTNLWRLYSVYQRNPHNVQVELHRKYGDVVRLGPDCVSVSGPDYASSIYGIGKGFVKSDYYSCFQNIVNGRRAASLVAMTDEGEHAKSKRQIAHAYSLSTLVEFESLVDSTTEVFLAELNKRFVQTKAVCAFDQWLQFYAFDVIGELTFSKRLGFIESGEDVDSIMQSIGANFEYFSVLGQMPWLDETFLGKSPLYIKFFSKAVSSPILRFAQRLLAERLDPEQAEEKSTDQKDFLSRFLQVRNESPEPMGDRQLLSYLFMNINAGSDTIASTLRAVFYYLLKNPHSLSTLVSELDDAVTSGSLSTPSPTWTETQKLPYLCAVIKEALRLNPALSLPLERIVPSSGLQLNDKNNTHLPPGTVVGINPYVIQRDSRIFGPQPDKWNPDRWLNAEEKETKTMEHSLLTFGAGKRSCLGKHIAMLELHKLVPAVLLKFRVELVDPEKEWTVSNAWALNQTGVDVRLFER